LYRFTNRCITEPAGSRSKQKTLSEGEPGKKNDKKKKKERETMRRGRGTRKREETNYQGGRNERKCFAEQKVQEE
jgi:hypothetical protein